MPAPTFRRGDQIARRYQVVTKSGETSLWVGYHACDQASQAQSEQKGNMPEPDVLVKVVRPELVADAGARERLVRDLQRMKGLQHPGLPRLMDVQILEELQTVALIEAIQAGLSQGVLLRRMVTFRQKERFSLAEVRQIGAQLASVLSYIHGQMLHHGDLRLETVILRPDGTKLCDIGLGAALPRPSYLEAVRKVNESELIAPEVREGKQVDARTDVYGLAALYKHLLSLGQGQEWAAVLAEKPAMQGVLDRGMSEDPAQRYGSIEALIADIEAVARTGQPIRKRINMSPVAMAVAAGRLPAEELNRSAEELPESARSRRNSVFDSSRSASSARSVRITQVGGEPAGESSASASSKDGPSQVDGTRPPSATSKAGGLPSTTSRSPRIGGSGRSVPPPGETAEPARPESTSTDAAPAAAAVSGEVPAAPAAASAPGAPAAASAAATPRPASEKSSRASRPSRPTGPTREPAAEPAAEPTSAATESQEEVRRQRPAPAPRDPTSRRSPQEAASTPRTEGERSDTSPRKSSTSSEERAARPLKLPPGMIVTSKLALAGALILAALVGALVSVVMMLLLRPTVILGPAPPAGVPGAATSAPERAAGTPEPTPPPTPAPVVSTPAPVSAPSPAPSAQAADKPAVVAPAPAAATDKPAVPAAPAPVDAPASPSVPTAPVVPIPPPSGADPGPATPDFPSAPVVPIKTEPAAPTPTPTPTPEGRKGVVPPLRTAQPAHPVAGHPVGKPGPQPAAQPVRPQKPGAAPASVAPKAVPPKPVRPGPPPRPGAHPAAPTGPQPAPIF